jgi:hypothetical protein
MTMAFKEGGSHDFYNDRPAPKPIFHNEFETPREPARIKPVVKVNDRGTYLGRTYVILALEPGDKALLAYADNTGVIHTLSVPQAAL